MVEMIEDGETGLLVEPAEPALLARAVKTLLGDPSLAARMGQGARRSFVEKYTPRTNFSQLMTIYRSVIERRGNAWTTERDFQSVGSAH